MRKAGLSDVSQAHVHSDPKKGDFYVAHLTKPGRAAEDIVAELVPQTIRNFPWPKSMRWGVASARPGALRWVRPLQSILCTFGPETEETKVIDFDVDGIKSGNVTYGHRFLSDGQAIKVRRFEDYVEKLEKAFVVLDAERRKEIISQDAHNLAFASGLELVEDDGLLEEVSGLVEWPVVLMGEFEEEFLAIPPEVIRLTIRANQKCFVTRKQGDASRLASPAPQHEEIQALSNEFILVSNVAARDGGTEIAYGNGKVVRARLSDALYFWHTDQHDLPDLDKLAASAEKFGLDLKKPLDQRMARLDALNVTFHAKLGTQGQRVERIRELAAQIAPLVGADRSLHSVRPCLPRLTCKPKLSASFLNFRARWGANMRCFRAKTKPSPPLWKSITSRRARPTWCRRTRFPLPWRLPTSSTRWSDSGRSTKSRPARRILMRCAVQHWASFARSCRRNGNSRCCRFSARPLPRCRKARCSASCVSLKQSLPRKIPAMWMASRTWIMPSPITRRKFAPKPKLLAGPVLADLLSFFHDRFKVHLKEEGARYDAIDAVLTPEADNLLLVARRLEALIVFINEVDGKNLLAGAKRAANILAAEEKKGTKVADRVDPALLREAEEKALFDAVTLASREVGEAIAREDFNGAMLALAKLRGPVDIFFDKVLVNDEDGNVRANRLALLDQIRAATGKVADFSKIAG